MKKYLILTILLFCTTLLTAQNQDFKVKEGGYFFEETGGFGLPAIMTLGYEKIEVLNDNQFLSTKVGINGGVWFFAYNFGVPHGVSMNFGKKHVFFETGLNGWFGYYRDENDLSNIQSDFIYTIGTNIGINTAFHIFKTDFMVRAYLNPMYNLNSDLIRKTFIWGGIGLSFRIHN